MSIIYNNASFRTHVLAQNTVKIYTKESFQNTIMPLSITQKSYMSTIPTLKIT